MSKLPRVELTQTQLFFPLPINSTTENIVKVVNKDAQQVSFKIRTNSKGRYAVRPASAFLQPGEESMIKFSLDPATMVIDGHAPDENCDDFFFMEVKFVVQGDDTSTPQAFWKAGPRSESSTKIRLPCKYIKGSDLPERMVLRNAVVGKPSPRSDAPSPKEDLDAHSSAPQLRASQPLISPTTATPTTEFIPLTRKPAAPPNQRNPDFVADQFKNGQASGLVQSFVNFKFSLPVVLLFMVLAFLAAFIEEDTVVTRFLDTYVLGE